TNLTRRLQGCGQPLDRRWIPASVHHLGLRFIEPQSQTECASPRRREPVRFLLGTWALVLDVEIERAVGVVLEWVTVANCKAVNRVDNLKTFPVIHGERPERTDGR